MVAGAAILPAAPVWASEAGSGKEASAVDSAALEEVVVTARKRTENLQEAPLAVSALTGEALAARGVSDLSGLTGFTPSLRFDAAAPISGGTNSASVFIRGIGQTDFNLTIDPGVGIYLDGVYISRSVGALLEATDVQMVQVLRGPQGALFGKNTIGGAILVTSNRPGDAYAATVEGIVGSRNRTDLKVSADLPLNDQWRVRVTGASLKRDGYVRRLSDGDLAGDKDQLTGRLVAEWRPSQTTSVLFSLDGTRVREEALGNTALAIDEGAVFAVFHNVFLNGSRCAPTVPGRVSDPACYNGQWVTGKRYATWSSDRDRTSSDIWGASITVDTRFAGLDVKSISAYRNLDSSFGLDTDASPLSVTNSANDYRQEQFSQELQVSGRAASDRVKYLLGVYYLNESGEDVNTLTTAPARFRSGGRVDNDSYAAFGQVTYAWDRLWSVTLGGRYTHEQKRFAPDQIVLAVDPRAQAPLPAGAPFPFFLTNPVTTLASITQGGPPQPLRPGDRLLPLDEVSTTVDRFTPSVTVDFRPSDDVMLYAAYAKGFKSGGFTQRIFPPEPEAPSFRPETVDAYEVGAKTELLERRLRLNSALFYSDYKDLQLVVTEGFAPKVRNAGKARIWGVESEADALIGDRLRANASVSYVDAAYTSVDAAAFPVTGDSRLVNSPRWQLSAGATADLVQADWGEVSLRADWSYTSRLAKDSENTPLLIQSGYHVVNASLTARFAGGRRELAAGVTNLTDAGYLISGYRNPFVGQTFGAYARPREWYVRLMAAF